MRRSARYSTGDKAAQQHYGSLSQQPDVSPSELTTLCAEYYEREVVVNSDEAKQIEAATRSQSESNLWYHHRRIRITASNFGMVAKRRDTTPVANAVKTLLYTRPCDTKPMRWGCLHEEDARRAYTQYLHSQSTQPPPEVTKSGLVIDINEPCLACSPDGNVTIGDSHGLVEFKCPYSASELTPAEAVEQLKSKFACKLNSENGSLQLKRSHNYYYQVQGQLAITGRPWCDFVMWTPKGMTVERIHFHAAFWEGVKMKLVSFYRRAILPELTLPRHISGQSVRELEKEPEREH